jgi:Na+/H+ antiporter NhaD/arsenite permease-like protein
VSNVGGCLTPIGDPPLFMGYLKGVPFAWVLTHCWQAWCVAVAGLIGVFYVFDQRNFLRAPEAVRKLETAHEEWIFRGLGSVWFIALILVAVLYLPVGWRELAMVVAAAGSLLVTKREVHEANDFNYAPLKEVAWLFVGIFATMVPALHYLQSNPPPLTSDHAYYWATGALSGVLDNAPTYLAFFATAMGQQGLSLDSAASVSGRSRKIIPARWRPFRWAPSSSAR